jgi:uncharacterized protein
MTTPQGEQRQQATLDEVLHVLREHSPILQRRYGVRTLGIFGSITKGPSEQANDIDLLVEFDDRPLSLFDFVVLKAELSEMLKADVDLVEKRTLKPRIAEGTTDEVIYP